MGVDREEVLRMTTYVLVGGAWLGDWCWQPIAREKMSRRFSNKLTADRSRTACWYRPTGARPGPDNGRDGPRNRRRCP